ncbi:zinc-binding dehydrogenase [Rhodococcus sp. NPDC127530]|uniref:zinc-binding dehydrogenase n=1 Tax=unclassified Rhodococcus (in: high G+C Gram-positive bacteria) TaxID=192944 RepID=UPI00363FFE0C
MPMTPSYDDGQLHIRGALLVEDSIDVVDDVVIDQPRRGEALVRLVSAGVCGSDLAMIDGKLPYPRPLMLGHEAMGVVEALGPDTEAPGIGSRVTLWMRPPCRACRSCVNGRAELCENSGGMSARGTLLDGRTSSSRGGEPVYRGLGIGAFSTHVVMPVNGLVPVPDEVPDDVAALVGCGVSTGAGAVLNVACPEPGDSVLIMGAGGVGLAAVMAAAAVGAGKVIVSDPSEHRRKQALEFGATHVVDPSEDLPLRKQLKALTGSSTVDVAIDAVGSTALLEAGYGVIRFGGVLVAVGLHGMDATMTLPAAMVAVSHKQIRGCFMGGIDPQRDLPRLFELYTSGRMPIDKLVTSRRPLGEVHEALDDLREARGLRTVLDLTL